MSENTFELWNRALKRIKKKTVRASEYLKNEKVSTEHKRILNRIEWDVRVFGGRVPVLAGTRLPVSTVLLELSVDSIEDIIKEWEVSREDIIAALVFASYMIDKDEGPFEEFDINKLIREEKKRRKK